MKGVTSYKKIVDVIVNEYSGMVVPASVYNRNGCSLKKSDRFIVHCSVTSKFPFGCPFFCNFPLARERKKKRELREKHTRAVHAAIT